MPDTAFPGKESGLTNLEKSDITLAFNSIERPECRNPEPWEETMPRRPYDLPPMTTLAAF